jgi:fatty-acyl-CoA synthase
MPSMTKEWTLGAVLDVIADADPDRVMTVCGSRSSTFKDSALRSGQLANFLVGREFGAHQPRLSLNRWECGQDRSALVMYNDLYADAMIGCLKARVVPVNVNHNYTASEIADALVAARAGAEVTAAGLHALCTSQLARLKAPKAFLFVNEVRRLGNGKPDYRWAKKEAVQDAMATSPSS